MAAAVIDLDTEHLDKEHNQAAGTAASDVEVDGAFGLVVDHLRSLPTPAAVARLEFYRGHLDAIEASKLAEHVGADGDTRSAQRVAGGRKTSRRERRKRANRAKAVAANSSLAEKMAANELTSEQVDAIAAAANKSDGDAARDNNLIDRVAAANADQARNIADQWLTTRTNAADTQAEHDRQRGLRNAYKHQTRAGLSAITLEGDKPTIEAMWNEFTDRSQALYLQDGGADIPAHKHARTFLQRTFDAAHELISAAGSQPAGSSPPGKTKQPSRTSPKKNRPKVVVTVSIDKLTGINPNLCAEQIGVGPIADTLLAQYIAHGDLIGALFGHNGNPLWLGRIARIASQAQVLALIVRDKGCVLCSASHLKCEAHHLTPWTAPDKGETDIDKLALLCASCHRELHHLNRTLYHDPKHNTWKTRPATPGETPPVPAREPPQHE